MKTPHSSRRFRRFAKANEAVSALEYAILVGVITIAVGAALVTFSGNIKTAISKIGAGVEITAKSLKDGKKRTSQTSLGFWLAGHPRQEDGRRTPSGKRPAPGRPGPVPRRTRNQRYPTASTNPPGDRPTTLPA